MKWIDNGRLGYSLFSTLNVYVVCVLCVYVLYERDFHVRIALTITVCHPHSHPKRTSVWNHLIYFSTELHNTSCTFGHKINTFDTNVRRVFGDGYDCGHTRYCNHCSSVVHYEMEIRIGGKKGDSFVSWNDSFTTIRLFVSGCILYSTIQCTEFDYVHHIVGSFKIMQTIDLPVEQKCVYSIRTTTMMSFWLFSGKKANKRTTNKRTGDTKLNKTTKFWTQNIVSNFKRFFPFSNFISVHTSNYLSFAFCNQPKLPSSFFLIVFIFPLNNEQKRR